MSIEEDSILKQIKSLQSSKEGRAEAREICFKELSLNPDLSKLKLCLAKLFYLDGYYEFSLDILQSLRNTVSSPLLETLISHLGGGSGNQTSVVAKMSIKNKN